MGLRVISFKIDDLLLEEMDYYANMLGVNRSEFIRIAIEKLIKEIKSYREREITIREVLVEPIIY